MKIELDSMMANKSNEEKARIWGRITSLIGLFEDEHHAYVKFFFDGYNFKTYAELKENYYKTGMAGAWKIPVIGRESRRPSSPGYLARESAFDTAAGT